MKKFKSKYPHLEVILEPGAAFAWQTGYLLSTVQDVFESDGIEEIIKLGDEENKEQDIFDLDYLANIDKIKLPIDSV
mgnify:CR=1 FL=1